MLAFGYMLLKGRGSASGYVRENGGQRDVTARDLPPYAQCELYAAGEEGFRLCGTEKADGSGNGQWTAPKEGALFLASGNQVLLWDGGDEAFLRAAAWLEGQRRRRAEGVKQERPAVPEKAEDQAELPAKTLEECALPAREQREQEPLHDYPFLRALPSQPRKPDKENPPERAYFLRPAGKGEPVDTLPERMDR